MSQLALLLFLAGCAANPYRVGTFWDERFRLGSVQDFHVAAGASAQAIEVDFEAPPPQQIERFHRSELHLPRVSGRTADPREHSDFIDRRVTAVGFGLTAGGYLLYCEGLPLPVLVPEALIDLELTRAEPLNDSIYPDRDAALVELKSSPSETGHRRYAYYRGAGGALVVPTLFSPATTPRIAQTILEVRTDLVQSTQRELKVLLLNLTGAKVLQGVFSRVLRVSAEPESRISTRQEALGRETPATRQPAPSAATSTPQPTPAPAKPAPAPGLPAPSPVLVQSLGGNNSTPQVAPGPRLPQDVAVSATPPRKLTTGRPISSSPIQNAQLQADIQHLRNIGATDIRVNQQQLKLGDRPRVGVNRPDLQFDYNGRRYHVEYDSPTSGRGPGHQSRLTSNDPDAEIILLRVP